MASCSDKHRNNNGELGDGIHISWTIKDGKPAYQLILPAVKDAEKRLLPATITHIHDGWLGVTKRWRKGTYTATIDSDETAIQLKPRGTAWYTFLVPTIPASTKLTDDNKPSPSNPSNNVVDKDHKPGSFALSGQALLDITKIINREIQQWLQDNEKKE